MCVLVRVCVGACACVCVWVLACVRRCVHSVCPHVCVRSCFMYVMYCVCTVFMCVLCGSSVMHSNNIESSLFTVYYDD